MEKPASLTAKEWNSLLGFYNAIDRHEWDELDSVVTPQWEDLPPAPGQTPGPEGVKPILAGLLTSFPDLRASVEEVIAEEGRAAVRVVMSGTHEGSLFGIPPTGKKVVFSLHEFHRFRDGLLDQTRHMEDWLSLFQQLGKYPAQSGASA